MSPSIIPCNATGCRLQPLLLQRAVVLCVALVLCVGVAAQRGRDSLRSERFRPVQLIVPSTLIAVGSVGVTGGWFCSVKEDVRDGFQKLSGGKRIKVDDYLQYLPLAAHLGLGSIGVKHRHSFRERFAAAATASATMAAMVNTVKYTVCESRPGSSAPGSFPSGHTATAFMGAELVRSEYGNAIGAGAYTIATGIAVMRLYNDRHWLNDVIAGAGMGILSARIGYWLLPWERRLFHWTDDGPSVSALPTYSPVDHAVCLSFAATF